MKPTFMDVANQDRFADFLEVYSGKGRLHGSVSKAWCLEGFPHFFYLRPFSASYNASYLFTCRPM